MEVLALPRKELNRAVVTLVAAIALSAGAASPAAAKVYSFKAVRAHDGVVTFAVQGVQPARVRSARVRIAAHRPRRLSLAQARRAARRGVLRLHVRRHRSRRHLVARASRQSSLTIVADTTAPETVITGGPSGTATSGSASFSFSSSERPARFDCRLDAGAWAACDSPRSYSGLAEGGHSFYTRARDKAGNADLTPASRSWTVDLPDPAPVDPPVEPTPTDPPPTDPTPTDPPPTDPPPTGALLFDGFGAANGPNGVITNEYAGWHSTDSTAVHSPVWRSDGGSLFSVSTTDASGQTSQVAATGRLDNGFADKYSQSSTHSNKMRFWTKATGFGNVRVSADLKPAAWSADAPSTWAGFKFYLRREVGTTESSFYTVEPFIKDGHVYIQKKCLGDTGGGNFSSGGTYYLLASKSGMSVPIGSWQHISATARTNLDGSVTVGLYRGDTLVTQAVDRGIRSDGTGCAPLVAGHVGFRSDYFQYYLDNFGVSALQ